MERPNEAEKEFLTLSYSKFYDVFDEIMNDDFWKNDEKYRFHKIRDIFSIYSELLNYEPIRYMIGYIRKKRPPMEAEIGSELFKFIRNLIIHFPFFDKWDEVWINKKLINWYKEGQMIDKFLEKYKKYPEVKYRFWEAKKKRMTYLTIKFPKEYSNDNKIFLKDMVTEKEGIKFSVILMKQILDTQIEKVK